MTAESPVRTTSGPEPSTEGGGIARHTALRSLDVIAMTAGAMLIADVAVSCLVVVATSAPIGLLIGIPVTALILVAVIIAFSRSLVGRSAIIGALAVTALLAGLGGYGLLEGILTPLVLGEGVLLHLALVALCAIALGLFLGPLPLRIVGAGAAVAAVLLITLQPTGAERAAVAAQATAEQRAAENLDYFLTEGTFPVVTDLPGWRNARVQASGSSAGTWIVGADGAVAVALVQGRPDQADFGTGACDFIGRPGDAAPSSADAYPDWCIETDAGWSRADGTALAYVAGDLFIVLNAADEYGIRDASGTRSATPSELAVLAGTLRPMSRAEVEEYLVDVYRAGDTPPVDTPGL